MINISVPHQVPIALPATLSLVSFAIVCLTFYQKPTESGLALLCVLIGSVFYVVGNRWTNKPHAIQSKISKLYC